MIYLLPLPRELIGILRSPTILISVWTEYPKIYSPKGRALNDLIKECLFEIEKELEGYDGIAKFRTFVKLTREGMGSTQASRQIGVTPEYVSRNYKRTLVELLTEKLLFKLR